MYLRDSADSLFGKMNGTEMLYQIVQAKNAMLYPKRSFEPKNKWSHLRKTNKTSNVKQRLNK